LSIFKIPEKSWQFPRRKPPKQNVTNAGPTGADKLPPKPKRLCPSANLFYLAVLLSFIPPLRKKGKKSKDKLLVS
jgi:hypothetical protein